MHALASVQVAPRVEIETRATQAEMCSMWHARSQDVERGPCSSHVQAGAIAAVLQGWHLAAAVLYVLSINHKHMLIYFAPAFFSYLLGCCLRRPRPRSRNTGPAEHQPSSPWRPLPQAAAAVASLGVVVIVTMLAVWAPFLSHQGLALKVPCLLMRRGVHTFAAALLATCACKFLHFVLLPSPCREIQRPRESNRGNSLTFRCGAVAKSCGCHGKSFRGIDAV